MSDLPTIVAHARAELLDRAAVLRRRMMTIVRMRAALRGAAISIGALILFGLLDFLWPAPGWARAGMLGAVLCGLGWTVFRAAHPARQWRVGLADAAGRAEERALGETGPARAAVELAQRHDESAAPMERALTQRAIERGLQSLQSFDPAVAIDRRPALDAVRGMLVLSMIAFALAMALPSIVRTQMIRLVDPFGDHPPYTALHFDIAIDPTEVRLGDDVTIDAAITGAFPSEAQIALRDESGIRQLPIMRVSPQNETTHVRAMVANVRAPLAVRIEANRGRSRWTHIDPIPKPRLREAMLRVTPPAYTGMETQVHPLPAYGVIAALVGATVEVEARTSLEIDGVMAPEARAIRFAGESASASWALAAPGEQTFSLDVQSRAGYGLDEPVRAVVRAVADEPPMIEITQPVRLSGGASAPTVAAFPQAAVPIVARASDDVAVATFRSEYTIARSDGESAWRPTPGALTPTSRGVTFTGSVTPQSLGAAVGDVIQIRFVAIDNRPDSYGGAQTTVSRAIAIRVVDEEFLRHAAAQGQRATSSQRDAVGDAPAESEGDANGEESESNAGAPSRRGEGGSEHRAIGEGAGAAGDGRTSQGDGGNEGADAETEAEETRIFRESPRAESVSDASPTESARDVTERGAQALPWTSSAADGSSAPILSPDVLSRLPARHRDLVARYYELLATQTGARRAEQE